MWLLLVWILFHKAHEKDEKNRSGCDTDDNGEDDEISSDAGYDDDVSVAHCNLSDYLVVNASDEAVEVGINFPG